MPNPILNSPAGQAMSAGGPPPQPAGVIPPGPQGPPVAPAPGPAVPTAGGPGMLEMLAPQDKQVVMQTAQGLVAQGVDPQNAIKMAMDIVVNNPGNFQQMPQDALMAAPGTPMGGQLGAPVNPQGPAVPQLP